MTAITVPRQHVSRSEGMRTKLIAIVALSLALFAATVFPVSDAVPEPVREPIAAVADQILPASVHDAVGVETASAWPSLPSLGCIGAITALVAANALFATKITKLGGAWKALKKIRSAARAIKKYGWAWNSYKARDYLASAVIAGLGEISGITNVLKKCS